MNFEIRHVKHEHDLISFTWNDVGGFYNVYKDGEHLYEGNVPEFQDGDFKHGKLYHYTIERVVNNGVVDVIAMQTSAFAEEKNIENPLQSLVMTTIVAKTQIALSWERIKNIEEYEVFRNGELVDTVKSNRYIDRNISLDQSYAYAIRAKRPLVESEEKLTTLKSMFSTIYGAMNPSTSQKETASETFTMIKWIGKPNDLLLPVNQRERMLKPVNHWKFRYTTFLREDWIKNPNMLSPNHYFLGDGRGFDPQGESFRTRVDIELAYDLEKHPMTFTKEVGPSIAYDYLKQFKEKKTASPDGITLKRLDHQKEESGFLLEHSVGNPLTTAPNIDYEVKAVLRRHGTFDISGYFDPAPDHEIYLSRGHDGEWEPVLQVESKGLAFMSDIIAYHYWRCSNFE